MGVPFVIETFTTAQLSASRQTEIRTLLLDAFAGDFSDDDWEHALGGRHVVVVENDAVVSHAAVVARGLEVSGRPFFSGYVEAVATSPACQRRGLGGLVMTEAAVVVRREFQLGALSTARHEFYEALGWERWQGPTFVRRDAELIRTEDEDDGVMILRFGPSKNVDLSASLSCEGRPGDDW